jgi:predicted ATP-grasp superfamily ATP-dependent carboligase
LTQETVLIAALSGRALASAARRAGFTPLVVDAFGDMDMRASAGAYRCLGAAAHQGFRASSLLPALTELERGAERAPIGLVLGSGFEDTPRLIASLAKRFTLLGNDAEAIAKSKRPEAFFSLLDRLGIAHPETRLDTPEAPEGWLSKRIGGSGGAHVLRPAPHRGRTRLGTGHRRRRLNSHRRLQPPMDGRHRATAVPLRGSGRPCRNGVGDRGAHGSRR